MQESGLSFTPIERSVSFYTRNDHTIMNHLLVGDLETIWKFARAAYQDNQGIIEEYEAGIRTIDDDNDIKWLNALKERTFVDLDEAAREMILRNAREDIANILGAMYPAAEDMLLYRTAWIDPKSSAKTGYAYSGEYRDLQLEAGSTFEIRALSSYSLTPYQEDEGSSFYRYELHVPRGTRVLELDPFITHNEDGEVILPPMRYRVVRMREPSVPNCKKIIELEILGSPEGDFAL